MAKLSDLVQDIRKMSDAELREHVRSIRHSKYVERPATAARKAKVVKKTGNQAAKKLTNILAGLSEADRLALIKSLEGK